MNKPYTWILIFIGIIGAFPLWAASFPVLPELQTYHVLGVFGSSYTTVAAGVSIHLFKKEDGKNENLHILGIYVPQEVADIRSKVGGWFLESQGTGFELGIYDQWTEAVRKKGANIALRHIRWEATSSGDRIGQTTTNILHIGFTAGTAVVGALMGVDLATIHTPTGNLVDPQLVIGIKTML